MGLLTPLAVRIGSISWMPRLLPQIVVVDKSLHRLSGGRVTLLDIAGLPNLTLTVVGRKSGIPRSTPLLCVPHDGAWLIAAVATQSIVVSRGAVDGMTPPMPAIQFLCVAMFMIGSMLYLAIIPLIFYRLTFVRLASRDFSPPYWINMGAVAITTLAGSTLILRVGHWPVLDVIAPFLPGFTLFFWAAASWWIPLLIALMLWRYLFRKEVPTYEPALWGMVFPLGMYTTATFQLSRATGFDFLMQIPRGFIYIALTAWAAAFAGLTLHIWRSFATPRG